MLTVVYENDQHSREVLISLLRELGFDQVHATRNIEETIYFLEKEQGQVDLIISAHHDRDDLDFPLSRVILKTPALDSSPLLVLTEDWRDEPLSPFKARMSRVDQIVSRPFGKKTLMEGIARAFQRRARFRGTLAFYGSPENGASLEEEIFSSKGLHWKKIEKFTDPKLFVEYLGKPSNRLGGIFFEADEKIAEFSNDLRQFKRSRVGSWVPLASFGQDPKMLAPFVTFLDLSFPLEEENRDALATLSRRSIHSWQVAYSIKNIRKALKENKLKVAKSILKEIKAEDPSRWELKELEGQIYKDPEALRKALETQPCSPFAYLTLYSLVPESERQKVLDQSFLYCPKHPGLVALRK